MSSVARHVLVRGRVQGVAFRWNTRLAADERGLAGWVRNRSDGQVEAWIEGRPEAVEGMLAWLRRGPPAASVEGCDVREERPRGHVGFEIERSDARDDPRPG